MKKQFFLLAGLLVISLASMAQNKKKTGAVHKTTKPAAPAAQTASNYMVASVNSKISAVGISEVKDEYVLLTGIEGASAPGTWKNIRLQRVAPGVYASDKGLKQPNNLVLVSQNFADKANGYALYNLGRLTSDVRWVAFISSAPVEKLDEARERDLLEQANQKLRTAIAQ